MTAQEILFGSRYRRARPSEIADALGVSERTVRRWQNDPGLIPLEKVVMLIRIQNIPEEEIRKLWSTTVTW